MATDFLTEYSHKEPVIALPEEDSLYINGDTVEVIGSRPYFMYLTKVTECNLNQMLNTKQMSLSEL